MSLWLILILLAVILTVIVSMMIGKKYGGYTKESDSALDRFRQDPFGYQTYLKA